MFVVFWRETKGQTIDPGRDKFAIFDSAVEAESKWRFLLTQERTHCAAWAPITGNATEPHWLETPAPTPSMFDSLCAEFGAWLLAHGLEGESDDAHGYAMRSDLTPPERVCLSDFIRRWDAMESERDSIRESIRRCVLMSDSRRSALQRRLNELG